MLPLAENPVFRPLDFRAQVGMPPERRLGGQVRYVPVPSWQAMPQIHHIHAQIAPSAMSILASPPMGIDSSQMLQSYPGGISHPGMNACHAFPVHHQAPVLDPSRIHGAPDMRELLHAGGFGQMASCQQMHGQPSVVQPAFPMAGPVVPGPFPGPVLAGVGNHSQQPTPNNVSASPPSAAAAKGAEKGNQEGPSGVAVEEDNDKDDSQDDDELSLSNIMLNMSLEEQTNMVGSYNGRKWSHRMAGLMGRENVFDPCNGDPVLRGFPEDDFGPMCASFDGILDITALDSFGQEPNLGLQENDRPIRAGDLLTSPPQAERRGA